MEKDNQNLKLIKSSDLLSEAKSLREEGYRICQSCALNTEFDTQLLYTFDKDHVMVNLKMVLPENREVDSITSVYWSNFIYENEMSDLFGIKFKDNQLDYEGNFFIVKEETPWKK